MSDLAKNFLDEFREVYEKRYPDEEKMGDEGLMEVALLKAIDKVKEEIELKRVLAMIEKEKGKAKNTDL